LQVYFLGSWGHRKLPALGELASLKKVIWTSLKTGRFTPIDSDGFSGWRACVFVVLRVSAIRLCRPYGTRFG
jgi:hypothetical protein